MNFKQNGEPTHCKKQFKSFTRKASYKLVQRKKEKREKNKTIKVLRLENGKDHKMKELRDK